MKCTLALLSKLRASKMQAPATQTKGTARNGRATRGARVTDDCGNGD